MMSNRRFLIAMAVLFFVLFAVQLLLPKAFVWNPTFYHEDRQPLGCYVFDSIMRQSLPNGYQVTQKSFYQLDKMSKNKKIAVLVVVDYKYIKNLDVVHLENIARRGGKVMIVSSGGLICDSLDKRKYVLPHVKVEGSSYFNLEFLTRSIKRQAPMLYDTLYWRKHDRVYSARPYKIYRELLGDYISVDSVPYVVLAYKWMKQEYELKEDSLYKGKHWNDTTYIVGKKYIHEYAKKQMPVAVVVPCGKGELVFDNQPLLFTNYGVLNQDLSTYVFRMMSQISDLPVYRTEAYLDRNDMQGTYYSPFREFLKRPPLRWALWLSLLGVVLFMIFSARRRQRAIPVITKPANKALEFVQLIGSLYYQRHDNRDLVEKKFRFFSEEVRHKIGVDVSDVNRGDEDCIVLARRTGLDCQELGKTIRQIRLVVHLEGNISSAEMRRLIDAMDAILDRL